MKNWIVILLILTSGAASGQTYIVRADSFKVQKVGGNGELIVENGTRSITGVLVNYGNGRTRFSKPRVNGDTLFVGVDTITGLGAAGWGLKGNALTTPGTDFIGTTDAANLLFKVNNQNSGFIEIGSKLSTFFGYESGESIASGTWNTGYGWGTLRSITTQGSNTALGTNAQGLATGSENVTIGVSAGNNLTGIRNVGVGTSALVNSVSASENSTIGNYSMLANRTGDNNTAAGSSALRGNADGSTNVAVGIISLTQNTTSITSITIPTPGTGFADGTYSLNISPPVVAADPNNNSLQATATATASGGVIVSTNVTEPGKGYSVIAPPTVTISLGGGSGATFTAVLSSGDNNTGLGSSSLTFNRTGDNNTAVGFESLPTSAFGSGNTGLGYRADVSSSSSTNRTAIGTRAYSSCDNCLVLGGINGVNGASSNTNVGIGTSTPTETLTVEGGSIMGRWKARVGSTASSATPTINTDVTDIYKLTALAANITSFTTNLTGTPNDGDVLEIQITDDGTPRTIVWGSEFADGSTPLPVTTVASTTLTVMLHRYTTSSYGNNKWICASSY